jgi:hypothetical protein
VVDGLSSVVVFRNSAGVESTSAGPVDEDYIRQREKAERAAAKRAATASARRIHQDLAQAYAGLVRSGSRGA